MRERVHAVKFSDPAFSHPGRTGNSIKPTFDNSVAGRSDYLFRACLKIWFKFPKSVEPNHFESRHFNEKKT